MLPGWAFPGTPGLILTSHQEAMSTFGSLPWAVSISQGARAARLQGHLTLLGGLLCRSISYPVGRVKKAIARGVIPEPWSPSSSDRRIQTPISLASFHVLAIPQRFLKLSTLFPLKVSVFTFFQIGSI